ncbi:conserved hypothetical protein [uncultured spirochete]|jgi:hypothetical protein|uniref:DUF3783 domain-containing protein n=1 Tax=uncultured spirochete TaxID=156406 RepID=A0A3P3XT19_9SPIR|nr:conserved hypothetical protein [uncultured spirochete]
MDENNERSQARTQTTERPPLPKDFRAIVMYGMSKEEALAIMKAVKAISPSMRDTAFAMTTDTNIAWPLGQLIAELGEEHRMMRKWTDAQRTKPE